MIISNWIRRNKHCLQQHTAQQMPSVMPLIQNCSPTGKRRSAPDLLEGTHAALHATFLVLRLGVPSLQNLLGAARLAAPLLCVCLQGLGEGVSTTLVALLLFEGQSRVRGRLRLPCSDLMMSGDMLGQSLANGGGERQSQGCRRQWSSLPPFPRRHWLTCCAAQRRLRSVP